MRSISSTRAAVGRGRQAAADDLAHDREVGQHAGQLLGAAGRDAEAGDDLVEDEQRAGLGRALAQQLEEARRRAGRGPCWPGRARRARRRTRARRTPRSTASGSFHGTIDGRRAWPPRARPGEAGMPCGRQAGARPRPAARRRGRGRRRRTSGASRGRSRRARGGWRSSPPRCPSEVIRSIVDRRHPRGDHLGELDLARGRRAEGRAARGGARRPPRRSPGWAWPWISGPHEQT